MKNILQTFGELFKIILMLLIIFAFVSALVLLAMMIVTALVAIVFWDSSLLQTFNDTYIYERFAGLCGFVVVAFILLYSVNQQLNK